LNGSGTHSCTIMLRTFSGMRDASFHLVTEAYSLPAERDEAPSAWISKYGWVARSSMKLRGVLAGNTKLRSRNAYSPLADGAGRTEDTDLDGLTGHDVLDTDGIQRQL